MSHYPLSASAIAASMLALASPSAVAEVDRYPTPAQLKQLRTAELFLAADGGLASLDEAEWCEELQQYLRERGYRSARQHHRQVVHEVVVELPAGTYRAAAHELVRAVAAAPAPLSRFRARFEVRRYDNTLVTARYDGEQWRESTETSPDPILFTRKLAQGQWMMSVEQSAARAAARVSLWDREGEANPYEVQALVALPSGEVHRSGAIPWNTAGVEVAVPGDFPSLRGKKLVHGTYRVVFEADGLTIDWPRSLPFEL